jgi:uncharacterized protein YifN (PemK superfamily)
VVATAGWADLHVQRVAITRTDKLMKSIGMVSQFMPVKIEFSFHVLSTDIAKASHRPFDFNY